MGREAKIAVQFGARSGFCTVLLEQDEIILRGAIKARTRLTDLNTWTLGATGLSAKSAEGTLWLGLSERDARSWLKKLQTPAPSLAHKLGFVQGATVALLRPDAMLSELADSSGVAQVDPILAKIWVAPLHIAADIDWLLDELAKLQLQNSQQLWVVRGKGPHALVKETLLMAALRQIGLTPSKTASISDSLTADRYAVARGDVSSSRTQ
jgi:hypothetical protein